MLCFQALADSEMAPLVRCHCEGPRLKPQKSNAPIMYLFKQGIQKKTELLGVNMQRCNFWGQELQHARKTPAKGGREAPPFVDEAFFLHVAILDPPKPARKNSYS